MAVREPHVPLDDFIQFVFRDENGERMFELINGEIVEVSLGRTENSGVAAMIIGAIVPYCRENNLPPYISRADSTYDVLGNVITPDVAYKTTLWSSLYPDPRPPEFAVAVISPPDRAPAFARKRQIYLGADVLCWEVSIDDERVDVYAVGTLVWRRCAAGLPIACDALLRIYPGSFYSRHELPPST